MLINTILEAIDQSMVEQEAPAPKNSRRRFLGAAAVGALALGFGTVARSRLGTAAAINLAPASPPHLAHLAPSFGTLPRADKVAWRAFHDRFVQDDGRVVDTGNDGISHTEGQGVGMLLAVAFEDRAAFDKIWQWTSAHLSRSGDSLHAWRYDPASANPISDSNNATDGDIYIAAALVRASVRWACPEYLAAGKAVARDLLTLAVAQVGGKTLLLPAVDGFVKRDHVVVNLSYYVFPLLAELQMAEPSPVWAKLIADGRRMVNQARFGKHGLPPDWLQVSAQTGALTIAERWPARFSFDAVRIPLFLAWAGGSEAELANFTQFWGNEPAKATAWVDLGNDICAPYKACRGVVAIAAFIRQQHGAQVALPPVTGDEDYYSASLNLISRIAAFEVDARTATARTGV